MKKYKIFQVILAYSIQLIILIIYNTCKWEIQGYSNLRKILIDKTPVMICVWHGRFLFSAYWLYNNNIKVNAVVSNNYDGGIISKIFTGWGFGLIKGSTNSKFNKGGINVIKKIEKIFSSKTDNIVAITNDGPKGPLRVAKSASLEIAKKCRAKIITVTGTSSTFWEFNSWDNFRIPKPFSKIKIVIAPNLDVKKSTNYLDLTDYINYWQDYIDEKNNY